MSAAIRPNRAPDALFDPKDLTDAEIEALVRRLNEFARQQDAEHERSKRNCED